MTCTKQLGIIALLIALGAQVAVANPPNFVVIFADDLGYSDLCSYGNPTIATPNLDQMAIEGQRWTQFYVAASVCTPSRAALLTGRLPVRSGMVHAKERVLFPDSYGGLPAAEITIAEVLKQANYATATIGKWHLGHLPAFLPARQGFDEYFGIPYSNDMDRVAWSPRGRAAFLQPISEYWNVPLIRGERVIERPANQSTITGRYTREAVDFIQQNKERPFFLYLAYNMPHVPLFASEKFGNTSQRGLYGDVVEEIDWSVGQVLAAVRREGLADNTLVVFTSDNGPWLVYNVLGGSAGLLREGKGTTWEGGMRVPAIFWWPGHLQRGVVRELGSTLDLLPTFASLAGVKLPDARLDGFNLTGTLVAGEASPRNHVIYYRGEEVYAVRMGPWKAHFITEPAYQPDGKKIVHGTPELYNLEHDPSERFDIAKGHEEVVDQIRRFAAIHRKTIVAVDNQLTRRKKRQ